MDDLLPSKANYSLLRKRLVEHEWQVNPNLLEEICAVVTKGQAKEFQVSGRSIRMDSKPLLSVVGTLTRGNMQLRLFIKTNLHFNIRE
jgi:hypothetical protein